LPFFSVEETKGNILEIDEKQFDILIK
jgi:hypothetical protein